MAFDNHEITAIARCIQGFTDFGLIRTLASVARWR
jgi:hypothetical protein